MYSSAAYSTKLQFNFNQDVTPDIPLRAEAHTSQAEAPVG